MVIGVIGKGKMGRDIFNEFFQFDHKMILVCRKAEDIQGIIDSVEKQLKKMLKRGYLTEAAYEEKRKSYTITNDYSLLKDCDLVIESVVEDREVKQKVFEKLSLIVGPNCILATNTSSIPLKVVFEKCAKKDRCLGMHFFYPVKVMRTVEINTMENTDSSYVEIVSNLLTDIGKMPLELKEKANMVLTKMFSAMMTQTFKIYEEGYLSAEEIDKITKEKLFMFGLFEVIDSTGVNIVLESIENFINDRYDKLYTPLYYKGKLLLSKGYPGGVGNKGLRAYEAEHPITLKKLETTELEAYKEEVVLRLQSLLINEMAYIINNDKVDADKLNEAVKEVLGLTEDPMNMLKRIGKDQVTECLLKSYGKFQDELYRPIDLCI